MRGAIVVSCFALVFAGIASGAEGGGFQNEAKLSIGSKDGNFFLAQYTYFLEPVRDSEHPYRLQPFFQQSSSIGGGFADATDVFILTHGRHGHFPLFQSTVFVEGRYMIPETVFGAAGAIAIADGEFFANLGADFYLAENLAIEARIEFADGLFNFFPGARYVFPIEATGAILEVFGGIRIGDFDGVTLEGRYYFDKSLFAGVEFTTDTDRFALVGGIFTETGLFAEAELGSERAIFGFGDNETFFKVTGGFRF